MAWNTCALCGTSFVPAAHEPSMQWCATCKRDAHKILGQSHLALVHDADVDDTMPDQRNTERFTRDPK